MIMKNNFHSGANHLAEMIDPTDKLIAQPLTINPPMLEQPVTPPAYMWDRIAKVLDEQDLQCQEEKNLETTSEKKKYLHPALHASFLIALVIYAFKTWH